MFCVWSCVSSLLTMPFGIIVRLLPYIAAIFHRILLSTGRTLRRSDACHWHMVIFHNHYWQYLFSPVPAPAAIPPSGTGIVPRPARDHLNPAPGPFGKAIAARRAPLRHGIGRRSRVFSTPRSVFLLPARAPAAPDHWEKVLRAGERPLRHGIVRRSRVFSTPRSVFLPAPRATLRRVGAGRPRRRLAPAAATRPVPPSWP